MNHEKLLIFLACLSLIYSSFPMAAIQVVYPAPVEEQDYSALYPKALLELALSRSGREYEIVPGGSFRAQSRALKKLGNNEGLDVVWTMTTREREMLLRPIRIPIYKGLLGWRVPLIDIRNRPMFNKLPGLSHFRRLRAGQVHDWPDVEILRHNDFAVVTSPSYQGLFKMLANQRIDYFPRSVIEIWQEADSHADMGIVVDMTTFIHYPTALYFFVRKDSEQLAGDILTGLEQAIASGDFDRLFEQYNQGYIKRIQADGRRIFELENPLLPKETPLHRPELWYTPSR